MNSDSANEQAEPDLEELANLVEPAEPPPAFDAIPDDTRRAEIFLAGLEQFFQLRRRWSGWLILWVNVLIAFQIILAFAIGAGALDFREYDWFLPLVAFQNFVQIIGMAVIVVKFLHSAPPEEDLEAPPI